MRHFCRSARDLLREADAAGFAIVRTTGGHAILHHADGRRLTIPIHPSPYQGSRGQWLVLSIRKTLNGRPSRGQGLALLVLAVVMLSLLPATGLAGPPLYPVRNAAVFLLLTEDSTGAPANYGTAFFIDAHGDAITATHVVRPVTLEPTRYHLVALLPHGIQHFVQVLCVNTRLLEPKSPPTGRDVAIIRVLDSAPSRPTALIGHIMAVPPFAPLGATPYLTLAPTTPLVGTAIHVVGYGWHNTVPRQRVEYGRVADWSRMNADGAVLLELVFKDHGPVPGDSGSPVLDQSGRVVGLFDWIGNNDSTRGYAVGAPDVRCGQ